MNARSQAVGAGTLLETIVPHADTRAATRVAAVVLLAGLTAVAAQVSVPWTPVPLTLTPMIVLLGGAALGSRLGMASQILYLAAGIAGLPVFAAGVLPQGPMRLLGPTGGYLMMYPLAAFLAGYLAERGLDRRYLTSVLAMLAGLAVIFAGGVTWLALFAAAPVPLGWSAALHSGLYPFVVVDLVKVCVAAAILPGVWALIGRRGL